MLHLLLFFWVLLLDVQNASVQAQTAIWKFPTEGDSLQANIIDTVLLDWTSTLPSTILRMWCKNRTNQDTFTLASSFYVDSTGPFKYVMESYEPNETAFPLSCHAELAADPLGSGFDSPAGIVWSSNSAQAAKTISQTQAASSVTVTVISTPSLSSIPTPAPPSTRTLTPPTLTATTNPGQLPTTSSTTIDSALQPNIPTSSTKQATLSTQSSEFPSGATTAFQQSLSVSPSANNTGAIIGGAIGSVALLSFVIFALLFLRKHQRDRASSSSIATEPSKRGFYIFNVYNKRGPKARTTGIFEKEGDCGAYEKEGTRLSYWWRGQAQEVPGSTTWKKSMIRGKGPVRREEDHRMNYSPAELPGDSSNLL